MGAKFSPSIANVYIGWWESRYLFHSDNPLASMSLWYGRYIDNLLFVVVADVAAVRHVPQTRTLVICGFWCIKTVTAYVYLDLTLYNQQNKICTKSF